MSDRPTTLRCERCSKEVGLETIRCPERASSSCPYRLQRDRPSEKRDPSGCLLFVGGMFIWLSVPLVLGTSPWSSRTERGLAIAALVCVFTPGLLTVIVSLYHLFGKQVTLFNPTTGAMWQQSSILGVKVVRMTMEATEPLSINLEMPVPALRPYPASITALRMEAQTERPERWAKDADALLAAALTVLLARGLLRVGRTRMTKVTWGRPREYVEYLILPGPNAEAEIDGALEQRMVQVVTGWGKQPAPRERPVTPTISELVGAIAQYGDFPGDSLVQMVQNDAAARGLCRIHLRVMGTKRELVPNLSYVGKLQDEGRIVRALQDELGHSQPDFVRYMYAEFRRGIASQARPD